MGVEEDVALKKMAIPRRPVRRIIDGSKSFHANLVKYWDLEEKKHQQVIRRIPNRFELLEKQLETKAEQLGDNLVARVRDVFHNGLSFNGTPIVWGDDQIRVFEAFLASCLPLIYGNSWADEKARVMADWGLERERMYSLVNMARRNGKTFVTSGTAAALLLCIPNIKIAIFSTCKRTSQMMMSAIMDMLDGAFERGTRVSKEDFAVVTKNMESVCFEGPDGTKRILGSFPGSVRVSFFVLLFLECVCVYCCKLR